MKLFILDGVCHDRKKAEIIYYYIISMISFICNFTGFQFRYFIEEGVFPWNLSSSSSIAPSHPHDFNNQGNAGNTGGNDTREYQRPALQKKHQLFTDVSL